MAELLAWPMVLAYSEAAVAYAGAFRGAGSATRIAIWGVRVGWLAQTALLVVQAVASDGFPWGTWAGALNLFVWLVVAVYLGWGCRPRYRLLGLTVMPPCAVLVVASFAGGGTDVAEHPEATGLLAAHVGMMLAAFAGFAVATAMAGLYLWAERRLKRRDASLLRLRLPSLETLDRLSARITAGSAAVLTVGVVLGAASYGRGDFDLAMAVTVAILLVYVAVLALRFEGVVTGRRFARGVVAGFLLVALVLPLTHFAS